MVSALNELFPDVIGLNATQHGVKIPAWIGATIAAMYAGAFASWSSLMWFGSLRRSLAHFRHMNSVRDGGGIDDAGHYLAPFRKATGWAFATLPIYIGLLALTLIVIALV